MTPTEYRYHEVLNNISRMMFPEKVNVQFEINGCNRVEMQKLAEDLGLTVTVDRMQSLWIQHKSNIVIVLWDI